MAEPLEAIRRCEMHGFDPGEALSNQFVIAPKAALKVPGLKTCTVGKWALHHGARVERIALRDEKKRLFGLFLGRGVDAAGKRVSAASFRGFNSRGRHFCEDLERYINGIAGRYVVLLDSGTKTRIYTDPMAQMGVFYNPQTRLVASTLFLTIRRGVTPDPMLADLPVDEVTAERLFPLGHSTDADVRWLMPNHVLDLTDFSAARCWPRAGDLKKTGQLGLNDAVGRMVSRQADILAALTARRETTLPLTGGLGARALLAAMRKAGARISTAICFESDPSSSRDAVAGGSISEALGLPFQRHHRRAAVRAFGNDKRSRRERRHLFCLRTGDMRLAPVEILTGLGRLQPENHLHLRGDGMSLLRAGWQSGQDTRRKSHRAGLAGEIGRMLGQSDPRGALVKAWSHEYKAWKMSLPKAAQALVDDFTELEMRLPLQGLCFYGYPEVFYLDAFADRQLIAGALQIPPEHRFGKAVTDTFIGLAAPELAEFPYSEDIERAQESEHPVPGEDRFRRAS